MIQLDLDKCLGCQSCVVYCPVAEVSQDFLGPRLLGPALERFRLLGLSSDPSLSYCANCKNCEISCPQNVPVASFNMAARLHNPHPSLRDWIVAHSEVIAKWTAFLPTWLKNTSLNLTPIRILLDLLGIAKQSPMPKFAAKTFVKHIQHLPQLGHDGQKKVVFYPGCYINYYDQGSGFDLVWLLNRAG
ncbi:MAG: 4Fe-4S binding protein, partial [Desulfovibrio sp.]|nr:4Fe-4S binding protein [Desulfovibrio sp.]